MSNSSQGGKLGRRMACTLCRDRKVRCDGGQPVCDRCSSTGAFCTYESNTKASKAKLQDVVAQLSERMEQNESTTAALLNQMPKQVGPSCFPPDQSMPVISPAAPSGLDGRHMKPFHTSAGGPSMSMDSTQAHGLPDYNAMFGGSANSRMPLNAQPTFSEALNPASSQTLANPGDLVFSSVPSGVGSSAKPMSIVDQNDSAVDLSHMFPNPAITAGAFSGQKNSSLSGMVIDESTARLLREFISLASSVTWAQQNIIGIASTLSEYSAYFHQQPHQHGQQGYGPTVSGLADFLDTIEQRMREISGISSQQLHDLARRSREIMSVHEAYQKPMSDLGDSQRRRIIALSEFFRTSYNLAQPLSEQQAADAE